MAYVAGDFDRRANSRDDAAAIAAFRTDSRAAALVFAREQPVLQRRGAAQDAWHAMADAERIATFANEAFLGLAPDGAPRFAAWLADDAVEQRADASDGFRDLRSLVVAGRDDLDCVDLRTLALKGAFDPPTLSALAMGKALLSWHARHGFCANCGARTVAASAGWRRDCAACKTQHFPRTDPVVIMLVEDGERCLLGRQPRFPKGFYSALAGFVEPGETIEAAVKREVLEEAGVHCEEVRLIESQPWPFPSSLMLGCFARATSTEVVVDRLELEDARWFTRAEVRTMLEGTHPEGLSPPATMAIARALISAWAGPV
jgi:NAD+ diphosphatase